MKVAASAAFHYGTAAAAAPSGETDALNGTTAAPSGETDALTKKSCYSTRNFYKLWKF